MATFMFYTDDDYDHHDRRDVERPSLINDLEGPVFILNDGEMDNIFDAK